MQALLGLLYFKPYCDPKGWNFFSKSIDMQTKIRSCRKESFFKINKRACTSIRYNRVLAWRLMVGVIGGCNAVHDSKTSFLIAAQHTPRWVLTKAFWISFIFLLQLTSF